MEVIDTDPVLGTINRIFGKHGIDAAKRIEAKNLGLVAQDAALRASWIAALEETLDFVKSELERTRGH
jgi:hypothetical protein